MTESYSNNENKNTNPLLTEWNTPYQTPPFQEIKHEHFIPAIDATLKEAKEEVDLIINNPEKATFQNTIVALEVAGEKLERVTSVLFNLNSAETDDEIQAITREVSPKLSEFSNYISLNEKLFEKVKAVYAQKVALNLSTEDLQLLEKKFIGFVRSGANLEGDAKKRYAEIVTELSQLSLQFGENILAETNSYQLLVTDPDDLAGLPDSEREAAAQTAKSKGKEGWLFTLHGPSFVGFMKYADSRKLREEMFRAYTSRGFHKNDKNNEEIIRKTVNLKLEKAKLLGFKNHAEYVLAERMAENPQRVNDFVNQIHLASRPAAENELAEVQEFAKKFGLQDPLQRWDWSYYSEKLKNANYGFDEQQVKPYFQLEKVREGIFDLATRLYGLTFKENKAIPVYHPDATAYEVYDQDSSFLSVLYLDFFPREGKSGGAWMNDLRAESKVNGKVVRPIITVVCNFTKPTETKPSLLTFNEVTTFLHEFGHALHGMLANTIYPSQSGTNVYRDFVELPSQIMENWATQKEWLDLFAVHYENGEKIPADLVQKLIDAENFQAGYASERQLGFGMNDMAWHSITEPMTGDIVDFEQKAIAPTELFRPVEGSCLSTAFSHIFSGGYAAGYYGYKWPAEVLDADAFSVFIENGIFDKATATSFRKNILEKGGTEHPMRLYVAFRGQKPSIDPLLERSGLKKIGEQTHIFCNFAAHKTRIAMLTRIKELQQEIEEIVAKSVEEAEELRIKYLSKKGEISRLFEEFRNVPADQKKEIGAAVNILKEFALEKINLLKEGLTEQKSAGSGVDLTLPGEPMKLGTRHPISIVKNEILDIFKRLGFVVSEGPEIEDDWHVFSALNFAEEHPARDMQDTFFIQRNPDVLLRTHTSSVQVHDMETQKPPIRTVTPGRVFRNEAISYRAHCMFHQIEGLYIDENVSFADLKQTLLYYAKELFGENAEIRMRPSYFPFTEPSAEVDVSCTICGGKGCNVCKYTGWLEILGCGMVDPNVLEASGIDSKKYTGYAFGMGIERIAMLKFGVNDLRLYFENDVRFLQQFESAN